jgi:Reverse transcriptase (RNA-dependent DNA polymerase)
VSESHQGDSDHMMSFKRNEGKIIILIIYIDDMIIIKDDKNEIERFELKLSKEFNMKILGGLKYFLGLKCHEHRQVFFFLKENIYLIY